LKQKIKVGVALPYAPREVPSGAYKNASLPESINVEDLRARLKEMTPHDPAFRVDLPQDIVETQWYLKHIHDQF
jgi:hypothetical protein